jgi:hypothetical protein
MTQHPTIYPTPEGYQERAHINTNIYRCRKSIDESSEEQDMMINEFLKSNYREMVDINDISPIAPLRPVTRGAAKKNMPKTPSPL